MLRFLATAFGCLQRLRCEREQAAIQREIDRLQELGGSSDSEITALWQKKRDLLHQIEALGSKEGTEPVFRGAPIARTKKRL